MTSLTVIGVIGAKALYLLFLWLASAIAASWLSDRKGFGEKAGLATGLVLSAVAVVVCSPTLLWAPCNTVEQMRLVNALCEFAEEAKVQTTSSGLSG